MHGLVEMLSIHGAYSIERTSVNWPFYHQAAMHGGKVLFVLSEHQFNGAMAMSDESTMTEPDADPAAVEDAKAAEAAQLAAEQAKLGKKFRIIAGEEILLTKRPSTFAFVNLYLLSLIHI